MRINLVPQRRDGTLEIVRAGETLIVNGEQFDFSTMVDGDSLPGDAVASPWFDAYSHIKKADGELELTLILPLPVNYSPAQASPAPLLVTADGPVALPPPLPLTDPDPEAIEEPQA